MFNKCLLFAVIGVAAAKHGVDNKYGHIRSFLPSPGCVALGIVLGR